jgi:DNA (cytosine-5)-methyltransferase 1
VDNPNNHLFRDFLRAVKDLDPEAVVLENVADLTLFEGGAVAREIRSALEALDYEVCPGVLDASSFGVPQRRRRLFFVAVRRGVLYSFPQPETTTPVSLWDAIGDLPKLPNGHAVDEMPYRTAEPFTDYQADRRNGKSAVRNNVVSRNADFVIERYPFIPQGGNWRDIPERMMQNYADRSRCHQWIYRRLPAGEPSITIMNYRKNMLIHPYQHRGLSVREAARIQSFDDDYVFYGTLMSQQQQVANAVPPLLARAVARSLRDALGL